VETFCRNIFPSGATSGTVQAMLTRSGNSGGEARLRYGDNDYDILTPGSFVTCAVTGRPIPLNAVRYWSVDLQEAYWDAEAAAQRLTYSK
jgi:hypothetical protein